jgi:periplasmic divalent cation tolerance protein
MYPSSQPTSEIPGNAPIQHGVTGDPATAVIVMVTVPDALTAVKIAESLLQQRLAACIHRFPAGQSMYRWQGKIETASEFTLLIKTHARCRSELVAAVQALHPYEVPEILALPVIAGLASYLNWIDDETG